jgi:HAD superfamily hydrolase (TIGR01549 family)
LIGDLYVVPLITTRYIFVREVLTPNPQRKKELTVLAIETVIFDLDGTLAHFNLDYKALRSEVRIYLMSIHVPVSVLDVNESIFEMLKKTEIFVKNTTNSSESFEEIRAHVFSIAERYEMEAASTTSLLTGAVETLRELQKMSLKMGICTTSSEKAANYILQRFKIDGFFKVIIPRDKVKYVKPHIEQFELALKKLGVHAKATLIVGDSVVDMQSAKELKAIAVGLTSGLSTTDQLMNNGANYIVTSLNDLPVLIREINKD